MQLRTTHINTNLHKYKKNFDSSNQKIDFTDTKILSHVNLQLSQNLQLPLGTGELHCSEHLKDGDLLVFIMGRYVYNVDTVVLGTL